MSITDPLLKELKTLCQPLLNLDKISDSTAELLPCLETLEKIFYRGIVPRENVIPPPWMWFNGVACEMERGHIPRVFSFVKCIEMTRESVKVRSVLGKFRLLVRCCLVHKCLHIPIDVMVHQIGERRLSWYHPKSIIGHEVLGEILLSVLLQISHFTFDLDLNNARFLDLSWSRPKSIECTMVPCSSLGLVMTFLQDVAVVVDVDRASVAAEDGLIETGDIFDEFNGHIVTEELRGKLKTILIKNKNQPIFLRILKMNCRSGEKMYQPILELYQSSTKVKHLLENKPEQGGKLKHIRSQQGYSAVYLGCSNIGRRGDESQIENAIRQVTGSKQQSKKVKIECRELDIIISSESNENFMSYPYSHVASCGHSVFFFRHFGFVVGNDDCSVATDYTCHVFLAPDVETTTTILLSLDESKRAFTNIISMVINGLYGYW